MSANRDNTQKSAFVYTNLYQLYRKSTQNPETSSEALKSFFQVPGAMPTERNVLKTANLKAESAPQISEYTPPTFINSKVAVMPAEVTVMKNIVSQPVSEKTAMASPHTAAIESLKNNLKSLNDLHSRLRFMLQELEELVKE